MTQQNSNINTPNLEKLYNNPNSILNNQVNINIKKGFKIGSITQNNNLFPIYNSTVTETVSNRGRIVTNSNTKNIYNINNLKPKSKSKNKI